MSIIPMTDNLHLIRRNGTSTSSITNTDYIPDTDSIVTMSVTINTNVLISKYRSALSATVDVSDELYFFTLNDLAIEYMYLLRAIVEQTVSVLSSSIDYSTVVNGIDLQEMTIINLTIPRKCIGLFNVCRESIDLSDLCNKGLLLTPLNSLTFQPTTPSNDAQKLSLMYREKTEMLYHGLLVVNLSDTTPDRLLKRRDQIAALVDSASIDHYTGSVVANDILLAELLNDFDIDLVYSGAGINIYRSNVITIDVDSCLLDKREGQLPLITLTGSWQQWYSNSNVRTLISNTVLDLYPNIDYAILPDLSLLIRLHNVQEVVKLRTAIEIAIEDMID